jgi:transglutaminase-like putative cysteine protease
VIYQVVHKTKYEYADAVPLSHNLVRMRPREHGSQTCNWYKLTISPDPTIQSERSDYFGNSVSWFSLEAPHRQLLVEARSEVAVRLGLRPDLSQSSSWEQVREMLRAPTNRDLIGVKQFVFDSTYAKRSSHLAAYALRSFSPGRPFLECVLDLTKLMHAEFEYLPGSTRVDTPVLDVLTTKRGVCQDFAHLEIACLRSLGFAARYVSGYIATVSPPGTPRLTGADASHAWISVFSPDFGWVDFDPTNGTLPLDSHITVAWGRDYEDAGPIRGVLVGGQRQHLEVSVDVSPADAAPPA